MAILLLHLMLHAGWYPRNVQIRHNNESTTERYCTFPSESSERVPVRFTTLGFGYYPALWCRGWYGLFPNEGDDLESDTVTFKLLGDPLVAAASVDAQFTPEGGALGVMLPVEGQRWGLVARGLFVLLNHPGWVGGNDVTSVLNLHLTFAVLSDPRGRLRLEAGVGSAFAPQMTSAGPSVGISGAVGVAGPVGLAVSAQFTPTPYRQYDIWEALTIPIGSVGLCVG